MPRAKTARNGNSESTTTAAAVQPAPAPEVKAAPAPKARVSEARVSETTPREIKRNGAQYDLESEIRMRAYELYEERGRTPGHDSDDWTVAEREVIARHSHPTA